MKMARELLMNEGPKGMVNAEGTVKVHISRISKDKKFRNKYGLTTSAGLRGVPWG